MRIPEIECISLLVPEFDSEACSSAQDNVIVKIRIKGRPGLIAWAWD